MKSIAVFVAVAALAGCVATPQGVREVDVRTKSNFRGDRIIPKTFPQIQQALFKHEAACGSAPQFKMDPLQTSYATLTWKPADSSTFERATLVDLTQYAPSIRADARTQAEVYSYYSDEASKRQIENLFAAISQPDVCPEPK